VATEPRRSELSLRNVCDLAYVLGVDPADLLVRPKVQRDPEPDDVRVEAALAEAGRLVGREELADLFGWSLRRTLDALHRLDERLSTTGQRLHRLHGASTVRVREGALSESEIRRLAQRRIAKFGLTVREARLLRDVLEKRTGIKWERDASFPDRCASGSLMKQGLIERVDNRFVASEDARYSLGLTDKLRSAGAERRRSTTGARRK
jgi:hypothetical protein